MTVDGGWTLAVRHNRKNRRRIFIATTKCRAILSNNNVNKSLMITIEELAKHINRIKSKLSQKFRQLIYSILERALNGRKISLIRIFGIGPFSMNLDSLYQLALLELLIDHFNVTFATSQDPLTTQCEKNYMEYRRIKVLPPDDLRSSPPILCSPDDFTLIFMIHCTPDMYDNVLSQYLSANDNQRVILIGNDPYSVASTLNEEQQNLMPFYANFVKTCTAIQLPLFDPNENAFSGTAICFIEENDDD